MSISPLIWRTHRHVGSQQGSRGAGRDEEEGRKGEEEESVEERNQRGLLLPAFMSQDIYVLPREGVNARRRGYDTGECQKGEECARRKKAEKSENFVEDYDRSEGDHVTR